MKKIYLDLPTEEGRKLFLRPERFKDTAEELQTFIENEKEISTKDFAKKVMFSHELKANNQVEGYTDDINVIESINKRLSDAEKEKRKHVINLRKAYSYILSHKNIDKESLRKLYAILSEGLIDELDLQDMGEYYRENAVHILQKGRLAPILKECVDYHDIEYYMEKYFEFLHSKNLDTETEEYIKSQILHYYFVYIHPYFDVNGRTSRTMSMWYLLNKKAYPYIIFNRGISFKDNLYTKAIEDVKKYYDLSYFIEFMLNTVKVELEKEYIMQSVAGNTSEKLRAVDFQTMLLMLTMKGEITVKDFIYTYKRFNEKKSSKEIYEELILPLIDLDILQVVRYTKGHIYNDVANMVITLNKNKIDNDPAKIKRLKI